MFLHLLNVTSQGHLCCYTTQFAKGNLDDLYASAPYYGGGEGGIGASASVPYYQTLGGDEVSLLTRTYPHKPPRKIQVTICNHQADSPLMHGLMSDLVMCKFRKVWSYMTPNVLTETRSH